MANNEIHKLPAYPSTQTRKSLSPSQLATINQSISSSLLQTIALPPSKRDTTAARNFVVSYAKDTAFQTLQSLIWDPQNLSKDEKTILKRALLLAEKIAAGLNIQSLLDLSIIYAPTNIPQLKSTFAAALKSNPELTRTVEVDLVPAFTQLLTPSQGLYAIRKTSHCVASFLHASPHDLIRPFAHSKPFVLALASIYDQGLASVAQSYGGLSVLRNSQAQGTTDEWEPIWVETKVCLMDAFHLILTTLLHDLSSAAGLSLAAESERTFGIIFGLLDLPSSSNTTSTPSTPFLDRPLLTDYQQTYSLSGLLASALRHAAEKDARLDLLESTLQSLGSSTKEPGVLKLLLRSSGVSPGIDNIGNGTRLPSTGASLSNVKGKEKASNEEQVTDIDVKITQVLDVLPEHSSEYIRALLQYPSFGGNPEKVVEALLEGTAPGPEDLNPESSGNQNDEFIYTKERRNVFDDEVMDLSQLHIGKKAKNETTILRDRTFIEQMKANILRRAEEISDDEEESEELGELNKGKKKAKDAIAAFDDDMVDEVKVGGDGEESGDDEAEDEEAEEERQTPETILELAYIRDPKLFDRDGTTRRSKARADLKAQTGWHDEQIEGWRIMLERNPKKDKILQKHEFAGNQNHLSAVNSGGVPSSSRGNLGGGVQGGRGNRGGGRGRGRGSGGGGRGGGGGSGESSARERAWKDKNKASRGNHNRKRGHDKKMTRAGAGPTT